MTWAPTATLETCLQCGDRGRARCPRCRGWLCRDHVPPAAEGCCDMCEDEYRPFSPHNLAIRLGLATLGTVFASAAGLSLGLIVGSFLFLHDPTLVRVLAMASATLGTVVGFGVSNVVASIVVRARFFDERAAELVPPARVVRGAGARAGFASH